MEDQTMTQFGTGGHTKVLQFLDAIGVKDVSGVQRVIIDVRAQQVVKALVTMVADVDAFDLRLDDGDVEVVSAPKRADRGVVDATSLTDSCRSWRRAAEGPERYLRTPVSTTTEGFGDGTKFVLLDACLEPIATIHNGDTAAAIAHAINSCAAIRFMLQTDALPQKARPAESLATELFDAAEHVADETTEVLGETAAPPGYLFLPVEAYARLALAVGKEP